MNQIKAPAALPSRPFDGNKGTFGRMLVVGGTDGMLGAPAMAGRAALKLGAGLVEVAVPRSILAAALTITPELIGIGLDAGVPSALTEAAEKADVIVIGPGLGQSADALGRLKALMGLKKLAVVDADALNMIAAGETWPDWFAATAVLTPHPGEMKRLAKLLEPAQTPSDGPIPADDDSRIALALKAAVTFKQILVLKGSRTVVTDGVRVYINTTGNSALSKAGTGDVLSGMTGCLLGQMDDPFEAACAAVWLHGRAGEIAGDQLGLRCVLSHDVIDAIPQSVREYEKAFGGGG